MGHKTLSAPEILKQVERSEANKVKIAVSDIDGILRGKFINKAKFLSAAKKGLGFCNVVFGWDCNDACYDNGQYTGWHTGYPDAHVKIALDTFRKVPWENDLPFFLADFSDAKGQGLEVCPRQLLKKIIGRAQEQKFSPHFGLEFEWFNFSETPKTLHEKSFTQLQPLTPGMFGYSLLRAGLHRSYFADLMDQLGKFDVPIEGLHTETGPGVYEAALGVSDALEAADRAILFKTAVKELAYTHGIVATFMAKWDAKLPGCSGHLHQSLWDEKNKNNLFFDDGGAQKMSAVFKHYLAGQMACLPEILPLFAPNINSYKRLVEGLWAPTRLTWGVDNRTTAFRVIAMDEKSARLESRVAGADINPYLAVAAALASGLYGIENKIELKDNPVTGNAYEKKDAKALPKNLYEATQALDSSKIARSLFGDTFIDHFVASRLWEWRQFEKAVTTWELERYFEII